jgi:hypothetical protein
MEPSATHPYDAPAASESPPRSLFRSLRFWIPATIGLIAIATVPIAFIIGAVLGETQIYRNFSKHQQSRIEDYLSQHPESFSDISVEHASNGWAYPTGSVPSQIDYDNLNAQLHEMFGDELAKRMMYTIDVETSN